MQVQVAKSVDIALVVRNWLFGWYIVEYENGGAERAESYGGKLLQHLSDKLKQTGIKGVSITNLKQFRLFYNSYPEIGQALPDQSLVQNRVTKIQQTVPVKSLEPLYDPEMLQIITTELKNRFILGWTHYVTLLTVKKDEERHFYEIEAVKNSWGQYKSLRILDPDLGSG